MHVWPKLLDAKLLSSFFFFPIAVRVTFSASFYLELVNSLAANFQTMNVMIQRELQASAVSPFDLAGTGQQQKGRFLPSTALSMVQDDTG